MLDKPALVLRHVCGGLDMCTIVIASFLFSIVFDSLHCLCSYLCHLPFRLRDLLRMKASRTTSVARWVSNVVFPPSKASPYWRMWFLNSPSYYQAWRRRLRCLVGSGWRRSKEGGVCYTGKWGWMWEGRSKLEWRTIHSWVVFSKNPGLALNAVTEC